MRNPVGGWHARLVHNLRLARLYRQSHDFVDGATRNAGAEHRTSKDGFAAHGRDGRVRSDLERQIQYRGCGGLIDGVKSTI